MAKSSSTVRQHLQKIALSAIDSVVPNDSLEQYLPPRPKGRCVVVGAGKASAAMAAVVNRLWADVELYGVVSTRYGHRVDAGRIEVIEAGHPVPDHASELAAKAMMAAVKDLTEDDLVLALISGGGSATCVMPIDGLSLERKQAITKALLKCGASISEINCVRKALSKIKGGGLALAASPARVHSLIISDIPGDEPSDVASGPTLLTLNSSDRAKAILARYKIEAGLPIVAEGYNTTDPQTNLRVSYNVIASPMIALKRAAQEARDLGYTPLILSDQIEGESRQLAKLMASIVKSINKYALPLPRPVAIISGGETTVTLSGSQAGRGGRNTEFLLAFANEFEDLSAIHGIALDSDGIDGTEDAAGAIISSDTLLRAQALKLLPGDYLAKHDSYSFFAALNDLLKTGPTLTNVNDIRVILLD